MIFIYESAFNPASAVANYKGGNDDYFSTFTILTGTYAQKSRIDTPQAVGSGSSVLTANTQYYAVTTSFSNGVTGTYDNAIGGVGTVNAGSPVPEPASLAILGLGALALVRRRRTSK